MINERELQGVSLFLGPRNLIQTACQCNFQVTKRVIYRLSRSRNDSTSCCSCSWLLSASVFEKLSVDLCRAADCLHSRSLTPVPVVDLVRQSSPCPTRYIIRQGAMTCCVQNLRKCPLETEEGNLHKCASCWSWGRARSDSPSESCVL